MPRTHHLPDERVHFTWDTGHEPVLTIESGDTVVVWTRDVSDNQITRDSDSSVIAGLDWSRVYPLAGPIAVDGARPGDTLAIEILDIHTQGWGWAAILPGLGLLPDDFPDAYLRVFDLSRGDVTWFREDIAIPLEPFVGTMGVCPAGASALAVMPPGTFGGNMDTRQLVRGATLFLPAQVDDALFSCGDAHGCQGDGDLYAASQDAIRAMVDHIAIRYDMSREDAYVLCSLAVDLKISEIVDAGQYIVSAFLPEAIFGVE